MTREEAKELLLHILMTYEPKDQYGDYNDPEPYEQALTMAIEALSAEPTDLIRRADAVNEIHKYFVEEIDKTPTEIDEDGDELYADMPTVNSLLACNKELSKRIKAIQSAEQVTGKLNNPCDSLLKADSESCKEQKSKLDLISRADALEQMAQAECGLHYKDCEVDNCSCPYIGRILDIPPADRPSGEWTNEGGEPIKDKFCVYCSKCKEWSEYRTDYCPNCGADMRGEKE